MNTISYQTKTYYALALDPIHLGTGGYRLGRVDNTILREPGTNLPKIPGTSLCGVARAYTAMSTGHYSVRKEIGEDQNGKLPIKNVSCAGKGGEDGEEHCGKPDCPVCVPYGFSKGKTQSSLQGMAQFFDARLLFFPIHSMVGPVWVTAPGMLKEFGVPDIPAVFPGKVRTVSSLIQSVGEEPKKQEAEKGKQAGRKPKRLNLGWLLLEVEGENLNAEKIRIALQNRGGDGTELSSLEEAFGRLVLISDDLFSKVVNDNLEVRTSVAIDPGTGAAVPRALYTYEAIPRAAVLWFDVAYNHPQNFQINGQPINKDISWVRENVEKGLTLIEHLGIGGMNTRGMGRFRVLNLRRR